MKVWSWVQVLAVERSEEPVTRQVPPTEKQPVSTLMPFAKVEVAPVMFERGRLDAGAEGGVAFPRMVVVAEPLETEKTELDALVKLASPVNHEAPDTESKEVEQLMNEVLPVKELTPEKVLLLERSVEEAAVMV